MTIEKKLAHLLDFYGVRKDQREQAVGDILEAVTDSGYMTPEQSKKIQELVNQMAQQVQEMSKLPVTVREVGTMYGSEWYKRFEKEIHKDVMAYIIHEELSLTYGKVMAAAKRAAGISDE